MDVRKPGSLGEFYVGWQQYADAFLIACKESGVQPAGIKPSNGYLRIECKGLPEHLVVLADAVERATDSICQICGVTNAAEVVDGGWVWKLCRACRQSRSKAQ